MKSRFPLWAGVGVAALSVVGFVPLISGAGQDDLMAVPAEQAAVAQVDGSGEAPERHADASREQDRPALEQIAVTRAAAQRDTAASIDAHRTEMAAAEKTRQAAAAKEAREVWEAKKRAAAKAEEQDGSESSTADDSSESSSSSSSSSGSSSSNDAGSGSGSDSSEDSGSSSDDSGSSDSSAPSGSPQQMARQIASSQHGWGESEFQCYNNIIMRESRWDHTATNPSSGAYGIPQSLPGDKMASAGADWRTNPATQIEWGLGYIEERYGTPCQAWSFWQANNWY